MNLRSGKAAGFTLIELLVSLVLLALLTTVLVAGLRLATQPLQQQSRRFEAADNLPVAYGLLRARLADARPIAPIDGRSDAVAFDGQAGRIQFVSAPPQGAAGGGLYLFSVDVEAGGLRARWRRFEGLLPAADRAAGEAVLLRGVQKMHIAYFGAPVGTADVTWRDEWRDVPYLPLLVRFEFDLADRKPVPALIVAPKLRPLRAIPLVTGMSR